MQFSVSYVVRGLLVVAVTYLLWRIQKIVMKYKTWWTATHGKDVAVVGPLHPVWGSLHQFRSLSEFFKVLYNIVQNKKPKMYCVWTMFLYPGFGACHPDTAQILYKSSEPKSTGIGGIYRYLKDWIGDGLLISEGRKWERNRRLLTPGFHFDILKPYVLIYNKVTDKFLNKLQRYADNKEAVDIFPHVALATLDTILRCAFSYEGNIQEQGDHHPYVNAVNRLSYLTLSRCLKPWFQIDTIHMLSNEGKEMRKLCQYSHEFSDQIIKERKQTLLRDGPPTKRHLDFLDILLMAKDENGVGLSDLDIRDEVDTFLFEGHDTTASAISWAIYCLGRYPMEQEIVHKEISTLLGNTQNISWENLQNLPRLTAFVKESMRMYSPVPGTVRRLTSPMKFGNVVLPAGVHVDINIHMIHHHPDVWPDHEVFKPERFLKEDITDRHPYSYLPFAAGSRNCIGQHFAMNELRVVVGRFIQRYKVCLVENHKYEINPELIMRAKFGIPVKLESR